MNYIIIRRKRFSKDIIINEFCFLQMIFKNTVYKTHRK
jgi:hypothetical protein